MRTVRNIAEMALDYCDVSGDTDILASATTRQKYHLCSVISGALQEVHSAAPDQCRIRLGKTISGPTDGTAVVTAGSTSVNLSSWGSEDLRGRIFRDGSTWNQFAASATAPGNTLLLPWCGTSGERPVTVYHDAFLVGSEGFVVVGNVNLEGYGFLKPCPERKIYTAFRDDLLLQDYGAHESLHRRPTGQPESWWVESCWLAASSPQLYLRLAPLPEREYSISYDLALKPRELVPADLTNDNLVLPIVADFYDSVLIPVVLQRWSGSPWFRNGEARAEIARQYQVAMGILADIKGQTETESQLVVGIN